LPEISQKIQKDLSEQGYDNKTAIKAALFTEEIGTTLLEQNGDNKVWVEYSLLYDKDRVSLIIRDSGKIFDVTDPDIQIKGLSSFVITGLLNVQKEKDYIPTNGYNRNIIRFNKTNQ
jgi:anti-sigma regulatory factor (Ser/Thr protein kinase)